MSKYFPKAVLLELLECSDKHPSTESQVDGLPLVLVESMEDGKVGRWSVGYSQVFRHGTRYYMTSYTCGATECQDESPYEYDADPVDCHEVHAVSKTITTWETVK